MENIDKLVVSINLNGKEVDLGELARDNKKIYFKYYTKFIDTGLQVSPFKLPLSEQIFLADTAIFEGLFGLFNDSLPDDWGRLLFDRALTRRGISINQIGPLDRLAHVGSRGIGALIYRPQIEPVRWDRRHLRRPGPFRTHYRPALGRLQLNGRCGADQIRSRLRR